MPRSLSTHLTPSPGQVELRRRFGRARLRLLGRRTISSGTDTLYPRGVHWYPIIVTTFGAFDTRVRDSSSVSNLMNSPKGDPREQDPPMPAQS